MALILRWSSAPELGASGGQVKGGGNGAGSLVKSPLHAEVNRSFQLVAVLFVEPTSGALGGRLVSIIVGRCAVDVVVFLSPPSTLLVPILELEVLVLMGPKNFACPYWHAISQSTTRSANQ